MKKTLTILSMLTIGQFMAQDIDALKLTTLPYDVKPYENTLVDVKSIFVECSGYNFNVAASAIEREINPRAYTIVGDKAMADLTVMVTTSKSTVKYMSTTTTTVQKTTKEGKPYTETTYNTTGSDKYYLTLKLVNKLGHIIKTSNLDFLQTSNGSGSDKNSAETSYANHYSSQESGTLSTLALNAFRTVESMVLIGSEDLLHCPLIVKSKKFDYTDINKAGNIVLTWIATNPTDMNSEEIKSAIKIYELALEELDTENKKVRVNKEVAALCYFELSFINFVAKNYAKANEFILKSEELDKRINYTQERLKNTCIELQKRKMF